MENTAVERVVLAYNELRQAKQYLYNKHGPYSAFSDIILGDALLSVDVHDLVARLLVEDRLQWVALGKQQDSLAVSEKRQNLSDTVQINFQHQFQENATEVKSLAKATNFSQNYFLSYTHNRDVRFGADSLYPIPAIRTKDGDTVEETPRYFPGKVDTFFDLDNYEIEDLLRFYSLGVNVYSKNTMDSAPGARSEYSVTSVEINDSGITHNKYLCLSAIARHIGLRFCKIRRCEGLEHLRATYPNWAEEEG